MQDWGYLPLVRRSFGKVGLLSTQSCIHLTNRLAGGNLSLTIHMITVLFQLRGEGEEHFVHNFEKPW